MKSVLISIQPKWCGLIAEGKKTVEVRKTKPKLETPFKCYIYETMGRYVIYQQGAHTKYGYGRGKVIGEFVCDEITLYEGEFWDDETYECVRERYEPDDFEEYGEYEYETIADNEQENYEVVPLFKQSCLTWEELRNYLGKGDHGFCGWHISGLKIYDKSKQLGAFRKIPKSCTTPPIALCSDECDDCFWATMTRPPQSWCYVEEN